MTTVSDLLAESDLSELRSSDRPSASLEVMAQRLRSPAIIDENHAQRLIDRSNLRFSTQTN
ncbi:MAG: hypothetical protein JJ868_19225 [Shimia sp.]|uniref:hypothetical protein n=1 Tax=Shimia sp. TaxID=1954381 RepID=UPI001B2AD80B|nr:hypothetical protein [Shimia sp.]MBO6899501.1 hypothetical protein [Shimia sp.]